MIDPAQLATESATAAFLWNLLLVVLAGLGAGGIIALLVIFVRAWALRDEMRDLFPDG